MGIPETLIFYLSFGIAVAVAAQVNDRKRPALERIFRGVSAVFFWPLYVPILLAPREPPSAAQRGAASEPPEAKDEMALAIAQVETELDTALASLDGWAEEALTRETVRLDELKGAWKSQAARIRELDRLLDRPEFGPQVAPAQTADERASAAVGERLRQSEQARQGHLGRLREVRRQAHEDLLATLAWVRELVTMIHLAKFTGAPASRAEELVAQIAAAVEGLSEVTAWREEPHRAAM
jgi:hypothetical protein